MSDDDATLLAQINECIAEIEGWERSLKLKKKQLNTLRKRKLGLREGDIITDQGRRIKVTIITFNNKGEADIRGNLWHSETGQWLPVVIRSSRGWKKLC